MKEKVTMTYKEDIEDLTMHFSEAGNDRKLKNLKLLKALGKRCGLSLAAPFFKHIQ